MMTCFGISYIGIIIGITITGTIHTPGIMTPGMLILGSTIPGMDVTITVHTIMQVNITSLHTTTLIPFMFLQTEGLQVILLTVASTAKDGIGI